MKKKGDYRLLGMDISYTSSAPEHAHEPLRRQLERIADAAWYIGIVLAVIAGILICRGC